MPSKIIIICEIAISKSAKTSTPTCSSFSLVFYIYASDVRLVVLFILIGFAKASVAALTISKNFLELRFGFPCIVIAGCDAKSIDVGAKLI